MAKHLTDKQKKKIIADYIECENYSAVARKYKVAPNTIRRICKSNHETAKKVRQKKEDNTRNILEHLEEKRADVCELIDLVLEEMKNPEKIKRTGLQALATSLGIVIDKFTAQIQPKTEIHPMIEAIAKAMEGNK